MALPERRLRTMHLFAGAGGGILGDLILGHVPVCAVELDAYARNVLLARQRDGCLGRFPVWDDIRTFDGRPWRGSVDVVSGGFPCQDISAAGKGGGLEAERSGLWAEMARVIREVGPRYVFVENSPMLVSRGLGVVLGYLAAMGFDARWGVFSAGDVGARHQRERIWILGANNSADGLDWNSPQPIPRFPSFPWGDDVRRVEDLRERSAMPFAGLCRRSDGVANRMERIKSVANGQVPSVAALAWRTLSGR